MKRIITFLAVVGLTAVASGCWASKDHQSEVEAWTPGIDSNITYLRGMAEASEAMQDQICALAQKLLPPDEWEQYCDTETPEPPDPPCSFGTCRGAGQ